MKYLDDAMKKQRYLMKQIHKREAELKAKKTIFK